MATTSARSTDGGWKIGYRVSYDDDEEFGQGRIKRSIEALIPHRFCSDGIPTAANNRVPESLFIKPRKADQEKMVISRTHEEFISASPVFHSQFLFIR